MNPYWLGAHPSYTLSKYGMTLLALGWAEEFRHERGGIAVELPVATDLYRDRGGDQHGRGRRAGSRRRAARRSWPTQRSRSCPAPPGRPPGKCYIDAEVLVESGVTDLSVYGGGEQPIPDLFLD